MTTPKAKSSAATCHGIGRIFFEFKADGCTILQLAGSSSTFFCHPSSGLSRRRCIYRLHDLDIGRLCCNFRVSLRGRLEDRYSRRKGVGRRSCPVQIEEAAVQLVPHVWRRPHRLETMVFLHGNMEKAVTLHVRWSWLSNGWTRRIKLIGWSILFNL
jgi:hypothetical protein